MTKPASRTEFLTVPLLVGLTARGLPSPREIAVGDGALGFWKALDEIFPATRHQRCWQGKLVKIFNKVPKSVQRKAATPK